MMSRAGFRRGSSDAFCSNIPSLDNFPELIEGFLLDLADVLHLKEAHGALVADVMKGSPAEKAGFRIKDVIIKFDGHDIREHDNLPILVANTPIGRTVEVELLRDGKVLVLKPAIVELSKDFALQDEAAGERPKPNRIGVTVQKVTDDIARSLGLEASAGVIVTGVEPGSPAFRAGIARGDVIEEIDNQPINDEEALNSILKSLDEGKPVLALIRKKEGTRFLTLKIK